MSRHRLLPVIGVIFCLVWLLALGACGNKGGSSASAAAVQTSTRFVYVANNSDNTISVYSENTASGQLQANNNYYYFVAAGINPISVTVDPTGQFAYVANFGSNNVSAYRIDASTGALTAVGAAVATGANPQSVTVDPTGQFAYVANYGSNDVSAYRIDASTGALTPIDCGGGIGCIGTNFAAGLSPSSITVDPTGRFAYVTNRFANNVAAYSIDASTGALTAVGAVATGTNPSSVITVGASH